MTQPAGRPMVPEDLLRIRSVSDPQFHPDGHRVAFVVTTLSEARDEYLSTIWIVDVNGGEPRPIYPGAPARPPPGRPPAAGSPSSPSARRRARASSTSCPPTAGARAAHRPASRGGEPRVVSGWPVARVLSRVGGWEEPTDEEERERSKPPRIIDVLRYKSNGVGFIYDRPQEIFVVPSAGGPSRQFPGRVIRQSPSHVGARRRAGRLRVRPTRRPGRGRRGRHLHGARRRRRRAPDHAHPGTGIVACLLSGRTDRCLTSATPTRAGVFPAPPSVHGSGRWWPPDVPDRDPGPELRTNPGRRRGGPAVARDDRDHRVPGGGPGGRAALPDRAGYDAAPRSRWSAEPVR